MDNKQQAIQIFKGVLNTKAAVTAERIIEELVEGNANPSYVGVILKKFEKISELVRKDNRVDDLIANDVRQYIPEKKKTAELYGAKITLASRTYWDYSLTEDPVLDALEEIEKNVKELIKNRKEELQAKAKSWNAINKPQDIVEKGIQPFIINIEQIPKLVWDETGGAEVETNPPVQITGEQLRFSV